MPRNFSWTEDEVLLVADAVDRADWTGVRATSEVATKLSDLLRGARIHPLEGRPDDFRSSSSVQRKAEDIRTLHPDYTGVPTRGGSLTAAVVERWLHDPAAGRRDAAVARRLMESGEALDPAIDQDAEASEGRLIAAWVRRRERDPAIRRRKLEHIAETGRPRDCEVCGFNFDRVYGADHAVGYVEVHHVVPLHVSGLTSTRLDDLVLLCANCHRMLHRGGTYTPGDLRRAIGEQRP
ncbi:HNH endonuclease [uncultured Amnibacterium sp.]|uniref:HNH endonuclease n=1 Tax=uncultured Amnibacterium sp. TaxID=1631851 RepID=UPI0035CB8F71